MMRRTSRAAERVPRDLEGAVRQRQAESGLGDADLERSARGDPEVAGAHQDGATSERMPADHRHRRLADAPQAVDAVLASAERSQRLSAAARQLLDVEPGGEEAARPAEDDRAHGVVGVGGLRLPVEALQELRVDRVRRRSIDPEKETPPSWVERWICIRSH
jgi:hypothetical protein